MTQTEEIAEIEQNCWRVERAGRAAVLIDAAAYFGRLREALLKAQRRVFIVGWDIDSRMELRGEDGEVTDDGPVRLGEFLNWLVGERPELEIHLLLWDYSVVYALERQPMPSLSLDWLTPNRIKVCLDDVLPLGASHHQKIVVIDDSVAFCGGIDLTIRRWDTPAHEPGNPLRIDPAGRPYDPFHDIQICVDGDAAVALAELTRHRWEEAACEPTPEIEPTGDPWPGSLTADFEDVEVAIARTLPPIHGAESVLEVEATYYAAIDAAERHVYIENQFMTAVGIADRLIDRMKEIDELEIVLISPNEHVSWLEARSMQAGRARFMQRFRDAGVADRVLLMHPFVRDGDAESAVMVHAKLMIVDDRILRVGSSNLNKRSMGMDTECDLAVLAKSDPHRRKVAEIRNCLLAEHLGVSETDVAESLADTGSLLKTVDVLGTDKRGLKPVRDLEEYAEPVFQAVSSVADPERPIEAEKYIGDMFGGQPAGRVLGRVGLVLVAAAVLIGFALAWRFTPLAELADPESLRSLMQSVASGPWAAAVIVGLFVLGGLIVFPVTVLIAATAMTFDPLWALLYAGAGSLMSAMTTYFVGFLAGRKALRDVLGRRINRISRAMARKGVFSVMAVRLVPVAPFTLINLVAGVSHVRLYDYVLGTILGMAPGIVIMTALGNRLAKVLSDPSVEEVVLLAVILLAWIAVSAGLQFAVSRYRGSARG